MKIVFVQKLIDKIRGKKNRNIFDYGIGNKISFAPNKNGKKVKIYIYGDNNEIVIKSSLRCIMNIYVGLSDCPVSNCKIIIGENTSIAGMDIRICEDYVNLCIGNNCLISDYIKVFCSDMHTIYDSENNVINRGKKLIIGNHVWIGTGVNIAKNSIIGDNCVVGMKSVVAGKFEEPNCVIAGNPARVVKHNVNWDRLPIPKFDKKRTETDNI